LWRQDFLGRLDGFEFDDNVHGLRVDRRDVAEVVLSAIVGNPKTPFQPAKIPAQRLLQLQFAQFNQSRTFVELGLSIQCLDPRVFEAFPGFVLQCRYRNNTPQMCRLNLPQFAP
jgi:hypothetical protein